MMTTIERKTHTIDATGKSLGRLASQVALLLRGKEKADFAPHRDMGDFVTVENVGSMRFTGKKPQQKMYYRHSGYLGGLREQRLEELFERSPQEVLRKAVAGMLPKTKLRSQQLRRLSLKK